jgi:hypothetical protein
MDFGSAESFKVQNRQGRKDRLHLPVITTWPAPSPFGKRSEGLASPPVEDQPGCRYIAADSQLTLRSRLCQYGSRRLRFRILTSSAAEVTFPVANEMKIVATSQASSKPGVAKLNRRWAFRNTIDEGVLGRTTVPYYKKSFNIKSVAIIFDAKDATAATVGSKIMPALMKENEIEVLNANDPLSFNTGDLDVSAQVTKIKALNPDGVVVSADYRTTDPRNRTRTSLETKTAAARRAVARACAKNGGFRI